MIEIDGAEKSGSGTLVRDAVSLGTLVGQDIRLTNIRARRPNPGLRAQHLKAVEACASMCGGTVSGARVGAREITYRPGPHLRGGNYQFDIGTAGSTTMLALTLLPLACFAEEESVLRLTGGLYQDFAPSAYHVEHVLFPILARMGVQAEVKVLRPGYVPRGNGLIEVKVRPVRGTLRPLLLAEQGKVTEVRGVALSSHLEVQRVSHRMAETCAGALARRGLRAEIAAIYEKEAAQRGANLGIHARTDTGCLLGADRAGQPRRSSESIGEYVARTFLEDLDSGATVDRYLADQLVPWCALAKGTSNYTIPRMTEHVESRLWLVERVLGAITEVRGNQVRIEGIAFQRR